MPFFMIPSLPLNSWLVLAISGEMPRQWKTRSLPRRWFCSSHDPECGRLCSYNGMRWWPIILMHKIRDPGARGAWHLPPTGDRWSLLSVMSHAGEHQGTVQLLGAEASVYSDHDADPWFRFELHNHWFIRLRASTRQPALRDPTSWGHWF